MKVDADVADLVIMLGAAILGFGVLLVAGAGWFMVYLGIVVIIAGVLLAYGQTRRSGRGHPGE